MHFHESATIEPVSTIGGLDGFVGGMTLHLKISHGEVIPQLGVDGAHHGVELCLSGREDIRGELRGDGHVELMAGTQQDGSTHESERGLSYAVHCFKYCCH